MLHIGQKTSIRDGDGAPLAWQFVRMVLDRFANKL